MEMCWNEGVNAIRLNNIWFHVWILLSRYGTHVNARCKDVITLVFNSNLLNSSGKVHISKQLSTPLCCCKSKGSVHR